MIIELHLLQSFPASNLNRDDVGQPKTVTFGGALRGRNSSQCLKRSARLLFEEHGLRADENGVRTKRLLLEAARRIDQADEPSDDTRWLVREALQKLGFGVDEATWRTQYLLFVGRTAIDELVDFCERNREVLRMAVDNRRKELEKDKKGKKGKETSKVEKEKKLTGDSAETARRMLDGTRSADIALFGRMIADNADFKVVGASQVAHAFSTHAVATEFDYFTAVDDLNPDDEAGASMIGAVDFNASLYYRYANVDLTQLTRNLDGDDELASRAANAWLESFIRAAPSGKQNSTAARTVPETLLTVVRERGAWNLANAFLRPVDGTDVLAASTERLFGHFEDLRRFYGEGEIRAVTAAAVTGEVTGVSDDETVPSMAELMNRTVSAALETA